MYYVVKSKENVVDKFIIMSFDFNDNCSEIFLDFYDELNAYIVCNALNVDDVASRCINDSLINKTDLV